MSEARDYLIWSHEHGAWWTAGHGYARRLSEAGRYARTEAMRICANAIPGTANRIGALPELPVRLEDVMLLRDGYRGAAMGTEIWD